MKLWPLFLIELVAFGVFSHRLGFYHDDWFFLEQAFNAGGFWDILKVYSGNFLPRPVNIVQFALFYKLGGLDPLIYQLLLLLLDLAQAALFFIVVDRLLEDRRLALLATALGMLCPSRAVTHLWYANSPQSAALVCVFASLALHQRGRIFAGQACYLLSLLNYESATFLPLILMVKDRSIKKMIPFALTLFTALAWQWWGVKAILGSQNPKTLAFSLSHILKVFGAGFECVTNRVIHICWTGIPAALGELGWPYAALAAFSALAIARLAPEKKSFRSSTALLLAAALFLAGYLPYALSGSYVPQIFGLMSRTNGAGAWVTGLLLACGISALPGTTARRTAVALVSAAFILTHWHAAAEWSRSWTLQQDILAKAAPLAARLPENATVVLAGAPGYVGHAVVFDAKWAFTPALRLAARRPDLLADGAENRYSFDYIDHSMQRLKP